MTAYLSGPMTGKPEHGFPAFAVAAVALRLRGVDVISPAELTLQVYGSVEEAGRHPWEEHLARDLVVMISKTDEVYVMPGWSTSRGARLEVHVARALNRPVHLLDGRLTVEGEFPCPCQCNCHSARPCETPVTEDQRALEMLGEGGAYVCGFCYSVCEGDDE